MIFTASDFITTEIHERNVVLGDGAEHAVYFRELPNTDFKRFFIWQSSPDEDVRAGAEARLLAVGLCTPEGRPALELEDAARLKMPVMRRLVAELLDVNGYTAQGLEKKTAPTASPSAESAGSGIN